MDGETDADRSETKVLVGKRRDFLDIEETTDDTCCKRLKVRDLESVFRSEDEAVKRAKSANASTHREEASSSSSAIDLDVNLGSVNCTLEDIDTQLRIEKNDKLPNAQKEEMEQLDDLKKSPGLNLDLSISTNGPSYPKKNYEYSKSRDESECASSVGPLHENDSMRVWKGLRQNNFMSTLCDLSIRPIPKPRGRKKTNNDRMTAAKKNIELAKKEQANKFAKIAAPSGLLNGLNPGIINHVRNSRQVRSIIQAMVKSEGGENLCSATGNGDQIKNGAQVFNDRQDFCYPHENLLALKLSSSVIGASEKATTTSCLSNEGSANLHSVTSLSVKAANVAFQWLELLTQDIKGRLSELRRSKKRVQAIITTELPSLLSREFSVPSKQDKDSCHTMTCSDICRSDQETTNAHFARWNAMFEQMEKALSEEENHLENWLNQVKKMRMLCEKGIFKNGSYHPPRNLAGSLGEKRSSEEDHYSEKMAVNAAAASIYSTCNLVMSMEKLPCC